MSLYIKRCINFLNLVKFWDLFLKLRDTEFNSTRQTLGVSLTSSQGNKLTLQLWYLTDQYELVSLMGVLPQITQYVQMSLVALDMGVLSILQEATSIVIVIRTQF